MQSDLDDFEKNLSKYLNSNFSIGVANATDGMELALMAIGVKKVINYMLISYNACNSFCYYYGWWHSCSS